MSAQTISDSLVNSLLEVVVNDTTNYFELNYIIPREKQILNHFIKWDTLSYDFPINKLPKNKQHRERMLHEEHDPYHEFYVFSYPFTDSIFTRADKSFMLKQSKDKRTEKHLTLSLPNTKLISDSTKEGLTTHFGYSFPIFSIDKRFAVIRKITFYSLARDIWSRQTFYYENKPNIGWARIYKSGLWEN